MDDKLNETIIRIAILEEKFKHLVQIIDDNKRYEHQLSIEFGNLLTSMKNSLTTLVNQVDDMENKCSHRNEEHAHVCKVIKKFEEKRSILEDKSFRIWLIIFGSIMTLFIWFLQQFVNSNYLDKNYKEPTKIEKKVIK